MVVYIFFFQAEDGIRDTSVTGVQTCALPILPRGHRAQSAAPGCRSAGPCTGIAAAPALWTTAAHLLLPFSAFANQTSYRSEERRVGKECRFRLSPYRYKKKAAYDHSTAQ